MFGCFAIKHTIITKNVYKITCKYSRRILKFLIKVFMHKLQSLSNFDSSTINFFAKLFAKYECSNTLTKSILFFFWNVYLLAVVKAVYLNMSIANHNLTDIHPDVAIDLRLAYQILSYRFLLVGWGGC